MVSLSSHNTGCYTFGMILFLSTTYWYKKKVDKNLFNVAMFGAGSYFASQGISKFFFENRYEAAAAINNVKELDHQKALGHFH